MERTRKEANNDTTQQRHRRLWARYMPQPTHLPTLAAWADNGKLPLVRRVQAEERGVCLPYMD